uniref:Sodium channel and clathrin linker 1 n=2 Tax=Arion vulgaris TaxID=1028688 RepID=A0A0B6ZX62_9EUPU
MSEGDLEFLKDQVKRLSSVLSRYQDAYPNFAVKENELPKDWAKEQPWLENRKELSPLLQEYDAVIYDLQGQLVNFQNDFERLSKQSRSLVQENDRLRQDLQDIIQGHIPSGHVGAGDDGEAGSDFIIQNLQRQLDLLANEKEAAQERWKEAAQEVDRLEHVLEMEKDSHQWRVVEHQAHQVKEQYQQSVTALNKEVESLQNDLRDCRSENFSLVQKQSELKLSIHDLQQQLIWKAQENADTIFKEGLSDSKIIELKRIMDELRGRLSEITKEANEMRRENSALHTRVAELQRKISNIEVKENEAIIQVREAVQVVEAAVLEKDQAVMMAQQKEQELEEMKGVVSKLINKAGARTREEVDNVRKQCNEQITKLTEELHALEMDGAEKQSRLDRLLREKRAVESELQQIYKEGVIEGSRSKEAYQQLNKRAIDAERARDEASVKIDNLQAQVDKLSMDNKQQKSQMEAETKRLQERLSSIQAEFEVINEDRVTSINKLNDMDKRMMEVQQERDGAQRKFMKELALIEQEQHVKLRDLEVKLQTTEDAHRQTVTELRNLLTAQQRMSARWKEECQTITHKFECKMEDLRRELSHVKKRNEELTSLLKESQSKTVDAQRMLSEYTKNIRRMEERVRESQQQAGEANKQVAIQSIRARQMTADRESLLAELTRSQSGNNEYRRADALKTSHPGLVTSDRRLKVGGAFDQSYKGELTLDQLMVSTKQRSSIGGQEDR